MNSAIDFRPLAVLELTKVNEKRRLAQGGFELAQILVVQCSGPKCYVTTRMWQMRHRNPSKLEQTYPCIFLKYFSITNNI